MKKILYFNVNCNQKLILFKYLSFKSFTLELFKKHVKFYPHNMLNSSNLFCQVNTQRRHCKTVSSFLSPHLYLHLYNFVF